MTVLEELGQTIGEVHARVGASTVGIGNRWRGGSGVVIDSGKVLTNAHNLHGDAPRVFFADGRDSQAEVAGVDPDGDLAVLNVDTGDAQPVALAAEAAAGVEIGAAVVALGNPGGEGPRTTLGFVSGVGRAFRGPRGRRVSGAVEHTAPLAPGSSGGPLVDLQGRLLGINTNRLGSGFYLAIVADEALRSRIAALGRGEAPRRRRLGVGLAPAHVARQLRRAVGLAERDGLLVREVEDDSAAARAGIAEGDLIVAAGGTPVESADDLFAAIERAGDGPLQLTVLRGSEERSVSVQAA